ncbi:hypothetical protein BDV29DRAFT_191846 [Aspergillus leporis]|uniref:ER-bound oxygenase mpaB/mpaB'/Rubber oxygenase catalytic domain-containing protein n=1 Tax=Aspergillus leporis TaxID=41062 RepID=A0A5N5WXP3_9EURO|nr:hypothetical protein BDV29DRAFT_191846 [Aspergillus leporis]
MDESNLELAQNVTRVSTGSIYQKHNHNISNHKFVDRPEQPQHIQKVMREGIILVAMPGIARAVDKHSDFTCRPLDRLRATLTYMYCMVYGTKDEKALAIQRVHQAHSGIKGPDYSAEDTDLQIWVAASLYVVHIRLYEQVCGALDPVVAEAIYKEYSIFLVSLLVPPSMWPENRQAFWLYWNEKIKSVQIRACAKNVARSLLFECQLPFPISILLPLLRLMTTEMLPDSLRRAYGLKTSTMQKALYWLLMAIINFIYPFLPTYVRTYPMQYCMKNMRRRQVNYQLQTSAGTKF